MITVTEQPIQKITYPNDGRPPLFRQDDQNLRRMQRIIDEYFKKCDKDGRPYTITGLAYSLDMTRWQLLQYQGKPVFAGAINKAKQRVAQYAEEHLFEKGIDRGVIFSLKNNFGWKDKEEEKPQNNIMIFANWADVAAKIGMPPANPESVKLKPVDTDTGEEVSFILPTNP